MLVPGCALNICVSLLLSKRCMVICFWGAIQSHDMQSTVAVAFLRILTRLSRKQARERFHFMLMVCRLT